MHSRPTIYRLLCISVLLLGLVACTTVRQETAGETAMRDADIVVAIAGNVWVAEYIHGRPVVDMSHTSMVFSTDGGVNGSGGCNAYTGTYALKDGLISFGPMAATMMMCAEALSDQEMRFFQSLAEPQGVSLVNGLLHLTPAEGKPSVFAVQEIE